MVLLSNPLLQAQQLRMKRLLQFANPKFTKKDYDKNLVHFRNQHEPF